MKKYEGRKTYIPFDLSLERVRVSLIIDFFKLPTVGITGELMSFHNSMRFLTEAFNEYGFNRGIVGTVHRSPTYILKNIKIYDT